MRTWQMGRALKVLAVLCVGMSIASVAHAGGPATGDCDWDGEGTIDELIIAVNVATGNTDLSVCPAIDANGDMVVTIDELITAVVNSLSGPPPAPSIALLTPNGGEKWVAGSTYEVRWASEGIPSVEVGIYIYLQKDGDPEIIGAKFLDSNPGAYQYTVTPDVTPGDGYRLVLQTCSLQDDGISYACNTPQNPYNALDKSEGFIRIVLASVEVSASTVTGIPGQTVELTVSLNVNGPYEVGGLQVDMSSEPIDVPFHRLPNGRVDCAFNDELSQLSAFALQPPRCETSSVCTGLRALSFPMPGPIEPIPDQSLLFTCRIDIAETAMSGSYPITLSNLRVSDTVGNIIPSAALDGAIKVVVGG